MNIILFDPAHRQNFYPFAYTQAIGAIRSGIFNNRERWHLVTGLPVFNFSLPLLTMDELPVNADSYWVDAGLIPHDQQLVNAILNLEPGEALMQHGYLLAGRGSGIQTFSHPIHSSGFPNPRVYVGVVERMEYAWALFQYSEKLIRLDFEWTTRTRKTFPLSATNRVDQPARVFAEDGVWMEHCIINAAEGPVFIGKNARVMEGSYIKGPAVIAAHAVVKAGARIYPGTNVGPHCTVGGEIKNALLLGYSNKAHDGYLGDSVIGQWCNLGAGSSNSNLRNDAAAVKVQLEPGKLLSAGLKCGLLMGDYSRCAINTSFNTGTFAGVACNVFGAGLTPGYLPNFTWGYTERYRLDKCIEHIDNWKKLKQQSIEQREIDILTNLYKK